MSDWSELAQKQAHLFETTDQYISMYNAGKHKIFSEGGARWSSLATTYCNRFCSTNVSDRMTADEAWEDTVQYAKDNYETNWLANIKQQRAGEKNEGKQDMETFCCAATDCEPEV